MDAAGDFVIAWDSKAQVARLMTFLLSDTMLREESRKALNFV